MPITLINRLMITIEHGFRMSFVAPTGFHAAAPGMARLSTEAGDDPEMAGGRGWANQKDGSKEEGVDILRR